VTIRRLNRAEYNNTIRDLVGVDFQPADDFPFPLNRVVIVADTHELLERCSQWISTEGK